MKFKWRATKIQKCLLGLPKYISRLDPQGFIFPLARSVPCPQPNHTP